MVDLESGVVGHVFDLDLVVERHLDGFRILAQMEAIRVQMQSLSSQSFEIEQKCDYVNLRLLRKCRLRNGCTIVDFDERWIKTLVIR